MVKLGITNPPDLDRPPWLLRRERHASFLLLEQLAREGYPDSAA